MANGFYNLKTVVQIISELLEQKDFIPSQNPVEFNGINFYPPEYFCPINIETGKMEKTKNTRSIHRYSASWESPKARLRGKIYFILVKLFGVKFAEKVRGKLRGK